MVLPNTVKRIGRDAFCGCTLLSEINWPSQLKTIEDAAFEKCASLTTLDFANGLKSIGGDAFKGCIQVTTATLPATIKEIGGSAFQECTAMQIITIGTATPPSISGDTFKKTPATILIPKGSKAIYAADKKWSKVSGVKEDK